ncbi:MAG: hypothetical protein AAFQ43_03255 [Bacteroidota bacterium]
MSQPSPSSLARYVVLTGTAAPARKIDAIKVVRRVANLELGPAKTIIDDVLGGTPRTIPLVTETDPVAVAQRFAMLGFIAEVDGQRVEPPEAYQPDWAEDQCGTVEVQALHDLQSLLLVDARVVSGRVASGDHLGIPLNGSTILALTIERVVPRTEGVVRIEIEASGEEVEFWKAMNVIGEVLPVLAEDDDT